MLDACPHHHEEPNDGLDGINLRSPSNSKAGKKVWRSLDELARTKSFETMLHREFPHAASEWNDGPSRRNFLKLMSASMALAGLSACTLRKPEEKIAPYVSAPEDVIPGRPLFYASSMPWVGYGKGVIVESHEGRPTKIEGNKDHPASRGASDVWMQASVLDLYDPDRSQMVMHGNSPSSWGNFVSAMEAELTKAAGNSGAKMRFLTGAISSPTIIRELNAVLARYPRAKWHMHEPAGRDNAAAGAMLAYGKDVEAVYHFDKADRILSLDNNFLMDHPGSVVYAKDFVSGRRIRNKSDAKMNRLYVAEAGISITGAQADHRLAIKVSDIPALAADILAAMTGSASGRNAKWVNAVARDLMSAGKNGLVVVGESQPAEVHAIVHKINDLLGAVGTTLNYIDPVTASAGSLKDLVDDINAGGVDLLFVIGTNPSFTAPHAFGFQEGLDSDKEDQQQATDDRRDAYNKKNPLARVKMVIHHGLYGGVKDETGNFAHWHVPASHYLEAWGDVLAFDGTPSIIQPLIYPLYSTKSEIELLALLNGEGIGGIAARSGHDIVKETWTSKVAKISDDDWQRSLEKGVVVGVGASVAKNQVIRSINGSIAANSGKLELVFKTDPSIHDGRWANNGWLQEVPKPISLLTWENVALMSVETAANLRISQTDQGRSVQVPVIEIVANGNKISLPAMIMPGHADDSITVYLGYGRSRSGRVAMNGVHIGYREDETDATNDGKMGANAYALKPATGTWFVSNIDTPAVTDKLADVATAQSHHLMDIPDASKKKIDQHWLGDPGMENDRELIHKFDLKEYEELKAGKSITEGVRKVSLPLAPEPIPDSEKLVPGWNYDNNKWGMVIDNQACIGCNSCVVACQSENNIAIVGKEEVLRGREMHWLRIDTYFIGDPNGDVEIFNQPIPCMQCENAPCALVCPVEATSTSAEGINEQTYNRCVGTRYCSNNCPYKVRRFNFLQFTDYETPQYMLMRNPNVTVRARGVMEKCNFCLQRVNNGRIEAKKQDRPIMEGEVNTACAQACPTDAIIFGNLNDKHQNVAKLQDESLRYTLLDDLNALPRVSYLARVRNVNPEM